jgi:hypothetical protein
MKPRIYLEDNFFNAFNNYQLSQNILESDNKTENKNRLIDVLKNSEIHLPLSEREVIKIHKKLRQNYVPTDFREYYIFLAVKNNRLKLGPINENKPYSLFLLDKCDADILSFNELNNSISAGVNYNFEDPLIPKSFASKIVDKEMNGIVVIKHRCKNVLIIDPYLFEDQDKMEPKIPNLIKLLNELYLNNSNATCHLSLLVNNLNNDNQVIAKTNLLTAGVNNPNLVISVYAHKKNLFDNNRHIMTDYSIIDLQHIFDRDNASISCDFLYDHNIKDSFQRINKLLENIRDKYNAVPTKIGLITNKFGNILENGLFEEL